MMCTTQQDVIQHRSVEGLQQVPSDQVRSGVIRELCPPLWLPSDLICCFIIHRLGCEIYISVAGAMGGSRGAG